MLKTFDHYCEYKRTPNGMVLAPIQLGKWIVVFCDEINLPDMDKYGNVLYTLFLSSNRTTIQNKEQSSYCFIECKSNVTLIAALFFIPYSCLIWGDSALFNIQFYTTQIIGSPCCQQLYGIMKMRLVLILEFHVLSGKVSLYCWDDMVSDMQGYGYTSLH